MKKSYFLFFAVLIANLFFAQTDLARWNNSDLSASNYSTNNITVTDLKAVGVTNNVQGGFWYNNTNNNIFQSGNWPNPQQVNLDLNKYIQFTISPKNGYKLNLSEFNFSCGAYGSGTLKVDYSIKPDFSNPVTILQPTVINSPMSNFSLKGFLSPLATDGQVVYVRVYFYNTNQTLQILFQNGNNVGPVFRGNVTSSSTNPIATNDDVNTYINDDSNINVLANDDYSNNVNSIVYSQPSHGTTTLNADKTINYLPTKGYKGTDSFTYKIINNFGESNVATVNINVIENSVSTLIRWDKSDYNSTSSQTFINPTLMTVAGGVTRTTGNENTPVYIFGNISNSTINTSKYIEFVVDNLSNEKTLELKKFSFTGRGYNPGNYQVRYSKKADFSSDVVTLATGNYSASFETQTINFDTNAKAEPKEKIYLRLYLYNNASQYIINYRTGDLGPKIEGLFYNKVYSVNETIWQNASNPQWSNGLPNTTKNAIIEANYNTSVNGNFVSNNLTINTGGTLTINTGGFISVNGQIANNNTAANSFAIEHDGNLLQTGNAINTGNATVKKSAIIPKMGYNYWSTPVLNQNLYQFSEGYNQASTTGTGTPWNRFYVYNEANDYFVTSIANDITLNATSVFQPARGYAIRGKNSFPETVTVTSPVSKFEFVGIPQNGDVATYNLKWTNAEHGYNMVGNPYPSNISFDAFFAKNSSKIYGVGYFWTNNDGRILSQQSSTYNGNNYAIATVVGGTSATYYGTNNGKPNGNISVGQGFIVQAKPAGKNQPLVFTNSMRNSDIANYYNKSNAEKNRFWLEFKSPSDINNEILIGYIPYATNEYDSDYDADLLAIGNDSFWSVLDNHKLAIQAKDENFSTEDVAKLGFKASVSGNYTITLREKDGIFNSTQTVYLKDKYLNKVINISENGYVFNTNSGQYEDRFEVIYKSLETLSTDNVSKKGIIISKDNQNFVVKSEDNLDEVSLYDSVGRLLYSTKNAKKEVLINKTNLAEGMYIIKVNSRNTTMTKKVLK